MLPGILKKLEGICDKGGVEVLNASYYSVNEAC
jgi:hypothetical protein